MSGAARHRRRTFVRPTRAQTKKAGDSDSHRDAEETYEQMRLREVFPNPATLRLDVIVHKGRNLKKTKMEKLYSWLLDTVLDPYVRLEVTQPLQKASGIAVQHSTCKEDNEYPVWEEEFSFLLDSSNDLGKLRVTIWDSNYLIDSQWSESVAIDLSDIEMGEKFIFKTLTVHNDGELDISLRIRKPTFDLRFGSQLHTREEEIVSKRHKKNATAIQKLLKRCRIKRNQVPVINVACSGGGIRAMVGTSGAVRALQDSGLLNCCTYFSSLSGSSWYLSNLYSLDGGPDINRCNSFLRERCSKMGPLVTVQRADDFFGDIYKKYFDGIDISLVDVWAGLLGSVFQPDKELKGPKKISHQKDAVATCQLPFPIYTAIHVKENATAQVFSEWIEFTPFEYGTRNFKTFARIEDIGSDKCHGIVCRRSEEFDLSFMHAVWGSAFAGTLGSSADKLGGSSSSVLVWIFRKMLGLFSGLHSLRPFAASLPNFLYGLPTHHMWCMTRSVKETFIDSSAEKDGPDASQEATAALDLIHHTVSTLKNCSPLETSAQSVNVPERLLVRENSPMRKRKMTRAGAQRTGLTPSPVDFSDGADTTAGPRPKFSRMISESILKDDCMVVIDAGLDFNLPLPPLLCTERQTDIFLVFDFTWRRSQMTSPFKELLVAEEWAHAHGHRFPTIPKDTFDPQNPQEYYIFEDEDDPKCPIVVFFVLCNVRRRLAHVPGQDESFANVNPFSRVYSTFNFYYTTEDFDRLHELCYYNTLLAVDDIKKAVNRRIKLRQVR